MFNLNGSVKVFGEPGRNPADDDILDECRLNEQPNQYDQGDQNQQYSAGYFPECFQLCMVRCKFMFSLLLRKSNTSKSLNLNIWLQIMEFKEPRSQNVSFR